jgi:hypothetical protein
VNEVLSHARNHGTRAESDEELVVEKVETPNEGEQEFDAMDVMDIAMKRSPICWESPWVRAKRRCIARVGYSASVLA